MRPIIGSEYGQYAVVLLRGGQRSYNDSSCSSPPSYDNDTFIKNVTSSEWQWMEKIPFSPRRFLRSSVVGQGDIEEALIPGPVYQSVRALPTSPPTARLTSATLLTDVWLCGYVFQYQDGQLYCRWVSDDNDVYAPALTLLAPRGDVGGMRLALELRPNSPFTNGGYTPVVATWMGGGYTSDAFIEAYRQTLPVMIAALQANLSELAVNVTCTTSFFPVSGEGAIAFRADLPMNTTLTEEEINNQTGDYTLGSEWQAWLGPGFYTEVVVNTLHHEPFAFADNPGNATWFLPQAAPSYNTTRPLFNFQLRRLDSSSTTAMSSMRHLFDDLIIGGHTGSIYLNDVVQLSHSLCPFPDDPSFRDVLGPVEWSWSGGSTGSADQYPYITQYVVCLSSCNEGYHLEPPPVAGCVELICAPNRVWMDLQTQSITRCVRNQLDCAFPLDDLGGVECEPLLPRINAVQGTFIAGDVQGLGQETPISNLGPWALVDAPLSRLWLTITGDVFFEPVSVSVRGQQCEDAKLVELGSSAPLPSMCYNISLNGEVLRTCSSFAHHITCTLQRAQPGVNSAIVVHSGRMGALTMLSKSAPLPGAPATLSTAPPQLHSVFSVDCHQDDDLQLSSCPPSRPFNVTIHIEESTLVAPLTDSVDSADKDVVVTWTTSLGSLVVPCTWISNLGVMNCFLHPWTERAHLSLQRISTGQVSSISAAFTFASCTAGWQTNADAALRGLWDKLCTACPPGASTNNDSSATSCTACEPGFYADSSASRTCTACALGHFTSNRSSVTCVPCPLNAFSNSTGRSFCEACLLNEYIVFDDQQARGVVGHCEPCPIGASCLSNGSIMASEGSYVLVDQTQGTLSTLSCSASACRDGAECVATALSTTFPTIATSQLPILNCCGEGRWTAFTSDSSAYAGITELEQTAGYNVLCALCSPGYSSITGMCVSCSASNSGLIVLLLVMVLVVVYVLHRLPHDWTGSATLSIATAFVQLSALLLSSTAAVPQLLALLNLHVDTIGGLGNNLQDGDRAAGVARVCITPLADTGRVMLQLAAPLIAVGMLSVVAALQLVMLLILHLRGQSVTDDNTIHECDTSISTSTSKMTLRALYRLIFDTTPTQVVGQTHVASAFSMNMDAPPSRSIHSELKEQKDGRDDDKSPDSLSPSTQGSSVARKSRIGEMGMRSAYLRSLLRLIDISYIGISAVCLSFFRWQEVGEFGWRLKNYPTLSPDSPAYRTLYPVVLMTLLLVVLGLPILFVVVMIVAHRKGLLVEVKASQRELQGGHVRNRDIPALNAALLQLLAMYRVECWWQGVWRPVRRLWVVLVCTLCDGSEMWSWAAMALGLMLALHARVQPFERRRDNELELLCLTSLFVQAALLAAYPPPLTPRIVQAALQTLLLIPLVLSMLMCSCKCAMESRRATTTRAHTHKAGATHWNEQLLDSHDDL